MPDLQDRAKAFENRFAHDAEMLFRAESRRNRIVGTWAAGLLGIEPQPYIDALIRADFRTTGPEDVIAKLIADLEGKATPDTIRTRMETALLDAKAQLASEV